MVRLGAAEADGVVLNWLTPEHAATTVKGVREAAESTGRRGLAVLYARLSPADTVRARRRRPTTRWPTTTSTSCAKGCSTRRPSSPAPACSAEDRGAARAQLDAYEEAGIDVLCLYPHGFDEVERARLLTSLAG